MQTINTVITWSFLFLNQVSNPVHIIYYYQDIRAWNFDCDQKRSLLYSKIILACDRADVLFLPRQFETGNSKILDQLGPKNRRRFSYKKHQSGRNRPKIRPRLYGRFQSTGRRNVLSIQRIFYAYSTQKESFFSCRMFYWTVVNG